VRAPRAKKRKAGGHAESRSEMAKKMKKATDADVWARMLEQLEVLHMVADTSGNLKGMQVKALRQVAEVFADGTRELSRRKDTSRASPL
jgi:hypothetical protein